MTFANQNPGHHPFPATSRCTGADLNILIRHLNRQYKQIQALKAQIDIVEEENTRLRNQIIYLNEEIDHMEKNDGCETSRRIDVKI